MDDAEEFEYQANPQGYELEGEGALNQAEESETTLLFAKLGDELQMLVQRYNVPPTDLEELFQVVQHMFELMDADQEALARAHRDRQEMEGLWKQEKDKLRVSQRKKLDFECRLEEEQLRRESEKAGLEKDKALLQTRVKQLQEHNTSAEQDLQKLKEKMHQNELARKELLEQYKKQADMAKNMTLRRKKDTGTLKRRVLPNVIPKTAPGPAGWGQDSGNFTSSVDINPTAQATKADNFLGSAEVPDILFSYDARDEAENQRPQRMPSPLPAPPTSLADELKKEEERNSSRKVINGDHQFHAENGTKNGIQIPGTRNGNENAESKPGAQEVGGGEGEWFTEEDSLLEEMLGVDPLMRTEVDMLQKEKETWEADQRQLEKEKAEFREQKEAFERQNTQLQVDLKRLRESNKDLQDKLTEVRKERDEILDNYLEQPFDEYCITRKELHELLVKHQNTAFELEKTKEDKKRLEKELESRRTLFERLKERWRKLFSSKNPPTAGTELQRVDRSTKARVSLLPVIRDLSLLFKDGNFVIKKEWLMSRSCQIPTSMLPHWMGQITLKGVETERIECSVVGRVFQSPSKNLPPNISPKQFKNPQQQMAVLSSMQQLHAEVWVATIEASCARIEIIDVIARPPRLRQRFIIKPKTSHIVCMRSIPGKIEVSNDFIDSTLLTHETEWMDTSFVSPQRRSSYLGPRVSFNKGRDRPNSAPKERRTRDFMASTPNLSLSSASDPGPLNPNPEFFASYSPETCSRSQSKKYYRGHDLQSHENNTDTSSTCSLTTIDEEQTVPTHQQDRREDEMPLLQQQTRMDKEEGMTGQVPKEKPGKEQRKTSSADKKKREKSGSRKCLLESSGEESADDSKSSELELQVEDNGYDDWVEIKTSTPTISKKKGANFNLGKYAITESLHTGREEPKLRLEEVDYDCIDGGDLQLSCEDQSPVMWIITEDNDLLFYPTTDPSHKPLNHIKLNHRAVCMEYVQQMGEQKPRVMIGHSKSIISIYHMDEFQSNTWDIDNPERISLPCANPNELHDVKCIACIRDRIWVGAGPSIFFLNAEHPSMREGSIFLDNYRRRPEKLLPLGEVVVVSTKGSVFYVFNAESAHVLQKFDVSPITRYLDHPVTLSSNSDSPRIISAPTDIKTMVADGDFLYVGTSTGRVVSIPINTLKKDRSHDILMSQDSIEVRPRVEEVKEVKSPKKPEKGLKEGKEKKEASKREREKAKRQHSKEKEDLLPPEGRERREERAMKADEKAKRHSKEKEEMALHCLSHSTVSVHSHMDERVRDLLFLKLPELTLTKLKKVAEMMQYHSLPNLASPYGGRIPISPPVLSFRSLVIAVGRGHVEYVQEKGEESADEGNTSAVHRERHEAFQLLVWGHKNTTL